MEESTRSQGVVRFGVFEVDLRTGELRKQGLKLKLQEKPFQILVLLLEHPGEVVTREDMRQKLWPADTFVDFDRSVNTGIRKLREALGESSDNPRFVETLARRGYRFIAPVERLGQAAPPTGKIMLAVLPLDNLSSDQEQEYFSDGLTEEMITRLAQLQPRRLGVIARTSVMQYKRTDKAVDQIGRELGVDYLIEGSVRRAAGRVRISAQLIQVNDQTHLWAENYERELADVFAIQSDVATRIACSLAIELLPAQVNILACAQTMRALPDESRSEETIMSLRESKFLADLFLSVIEDEVKKNVKIFKAIPEARRSAPHHYLFARAASGGRDSRSPCRRRSPAPHRGSPHKRLRPQPNPRRETRSVPCGRAPCRPTR